MKPLAPKIRLPLFVAVNAGCNMRCWYCTEHGENRTFGKGRLSTARLLEVLTVAYKQGVRAFRFTGGEPTLRRELGEILLDTQKLGRDVRIAITTNGARLAELTDVLARLIEPRVFLSVDGIAVHEPPPPSAGEFQIEKWLTGELAEVVRGLRPYSRIRLNYVLTRANADQLAPLIDFASAEQIDIKIFELLLRDFFYAGPRPREEVFREQYLPVRSLLPGLRERYGAARPFGGLGGRGIPMRAFKTADSRVIYFDSLVGSHYGKTCASCPLFPCQEGLYSLVLDANGTLHPAGCLNQALYRRLASATPQQTAVAFQELQTEIRRASFTPAVPANLNQPIALAA